METMLKIIIKIILLPFVLIAVVVALPFLLILKGIQVFLEWIFKEEDKKVS